MAPVAPAAREFIPKRGAHAKAQKPTRSFAGDASRKAQVPSNAQARKAKKSTLPLLALVLALFAALMPSLCSLLVLPFWMQRLATCVSALCLSVAVLLLVHEVLQLIMNKRERSQSSALPSERDAELSSLLTPYQKEEQHDAAGGAHARSRTMYNSSVASTPHAHTAVAASPTYNPLPLVGSVDASSPAGSGRASNVSVSTALSRWFGTPASQLIERGSSIRSASDCEEMQPFVSPAQSLSGLYSTDSSADPASMQALPANGAQTSWSVQQQEQQQHYHQQQSTPTEYKKSPPAEVKRSPKDKHGEASTLTANDTAQAALERLRPGVDRVSLTDRVREWISQCVLRQTMRALQVSTTLASDGCSKALQDTVDLQPLTQPDGINIEQQEKLLSDASAKLQQAASSNLNALTYLKYIERHHALLYTLNGYSPKGLAISVPPGYVVQRMSELMQGTCLEAFHWNGGGQYNGQPWTNELPDDSQLLIHLVAAFLQNDGWAVEGTQDFASQAHASYWGGSSGELYIGTLPHQLPNRYFAIVSSRPHSLQGQGTVLIVPRKVPSEFHLVLEGEHVLHLNDRMGLFDALALFFVDADRVGNGMLGARLRLRSQVIGLQKLLNE